MNLLYKLSFLTCFLFLVSAKKTTAQNTLSADTIPKYKIVITGPQYKRSGWHDFFWGKNYRKEWATPVKLPVFLLDNEKGGLIAIKEGGGHQTSSLHLETKDGKDYSLRS